MHSKDGRFYLFIYCYHDEKVLIYSIPNLIIFKSSRNKTNLQKESLFAEIWAYWKKYSTCFENSGLHYFWNIPLQLRKFCWQGKNYNYKWIFNLIWLQNNNIWIKDEKNDFFLNVLGQINSLHLHKFAENRSCEFIFDFGFFQMTFVFWEHLQKWSAIIHNLFAIKMQWRKCVVGIHLKLVPGT